MIIAITLGILIVLTLFSFVLGENFIGASVDIFIDNSALVNGSITTFEVLTEDVFFQVDTTELLIAGIALLIAIVAVASITGIQILASGLNPESAKIVIMLVGYIGIWYALSIIAFNLITSIEVFGSVLYISITLGYSIGVIQKISG